MNLGIAYIFLIARLNPSLPSPGRESHKAIAFLNFLLLFLRLHDHKNILVIFLHQVPFAGEFFELLGI